MVITSKSGPFLATNCASLSMMFLVSGSSGGLGRSILLSETLDCYN